MRWNAYFRYAGRSIFEIGRTVGDGYRLVILGFVMTFSMWNEIEAYEELREGEGYVFVRVQGHKLLRKNRHVVYHSQSSSPPTGQH